MKDYSLFGILHSEDRPVLGPTEEMKNAADKSKCGILEICCAATASSSLTLLSGAVCPELESHGDSEGRTNPSERRREDRSPEANFSQGLTTEVAGSSITSREHSLRSSRGDERPEFYQCAHCYYRTGRRDRFEKHNKMWFLFSPGFLSEKQIRKILKCSHCEYVADSLESAKHHFETHKGKIICPKCRVPLYSKRTLTHHLKKYCSESWRQKRSSKASSSQELTTEVAGSSIAPAEHRVELPLRLPSQSMTPLDLSRKGQSSSQGNWLPELLQCARCNYQTVNPHTLSQHFRICSSNDPRHVREGNSETTFPCRSCAYVARSLPCAKKHARVREGEVICEKCKARVRSFLALLNHLNKYCLGTRIASNSITPGEDNDSASNEENLPSNAMHLPNCSSNRGKGGTAGSLNISVISPNPPNISQNSGQGEALPEIPLNLTKTRGIPENKRPSSSPSLFMTPLVSSQKSHSPNQAEEVSVSPLDLTKLSAIQA